MDDVRGRTAFVTGAGQGIGLGIAKALRRAGAKVAMVDLDEQRLEAAAELDQGDDVATFVLDVRDRVAFGRVADAVEERLGPVSLLFNNAGVAGAVPAREMTYEHWDWVLGVNVHGVVNGVQTFVPRMIERGLGGYLVNTASGAGLVGYVTNFLYVTSKFAVVGLSEALQPELAQHGIGVSVLCPGPVATNIVENTDRLKPASVASLDEHARSMVHQMLQAGTSPDAVGEMVLAAMAAGRLYIHTDNVMEAPIKHRTQLLLDALPSALQA